MSKREYIKPCILNKEALVPDQAIAGCTQKADNTKYTREFKGYFDGWGTGTYPNPDHTTLDYEEAKKFGQICAVYSIKDADGLELVKVIDQNADGTMEYINTVNNPSDWTFWQLKILELFNS